MKRREAQRQREIEREKLHDWHNCFECIECKNKLYKIASNCNSLVDRVAFTACVVFFLFQTFQNSFFGLFLKNWHCYRMHRSTYYVHCTCSRCSQFWEDFFSSHSREKNIQNEHTQKYIDRCVHIPSFFSH